METISVIGDDIYKSIVKPSIKQRLQLPKTVNVYLEKILNQIKTTLNWIDKMWDYILLFTCYVTFVLSLTNVILSLTYIFRPQTSDKETLLKDLNLSEPPIFLYIHFVINVPGLIFSPINFYIISSKSEGKLLAVPRIAWFSACVCLPIIVTEMFRYGSQYDMKNILYSARIYNTTAYENLEKFFHNKVKFDFIEAMDSNLTAYKNLENFLKCCGVEDGDPCVNTTSTPATMSPAPIRGCYSSIFDKQDTVFTNVFYIDIAIIIMELPLLFYTGNREKTTEEDESSD